MFLLIVLLCSKGADSVCWYDVYHDALTKDQCDYARMFSDNKMNNAETSADSICIPTPFGEKL